MDSVKIKASTIIGITFSFLFYFNSAIAKDLNIFLGFEDQKLKKEITQFHQCLNQQQILSHYKIEPFIHHFPLHITLYLSSFAEDTWPQLIQKVGALSKQWSNFNIKTAGVDLTPSDYLMLDVDFQREHHDEPLQKLSDQTVLALHDIRDLSASIPLWAAAIPVKHKAFNRYGSPNVFFEYNPHFTLFAKEFIEPKVEKRFHLEMKKALSQCRIEPMTLKTQYIGVGEVDHFGQITKVLAKFPLD